MAECNTCEDRNPTTPTYSKAVPVVNENCETCSQSGYSFYILGTPDTEGSNKPIVITGTDPIEVEDLSNSIENRFNVKYSPPVQLTAALSLVAKDSGGVQLNNLILKGKVVDSVELSWTYSRPADIASQSLTNDGGLAVPSLDPLDNSYTYPAGQAITDDVEFTLDGDDGKGNNPESTAQDTAKILFGNYRGWGVGVRRDTGSYTKAQMISFIESLIQGAGTVEIDTDRLKSELVGEGATTNDYFYYFYPKSWGFAKFFQNGFNGGFKRLASVGGTIVSASLDSLEAGEEDILISNGLTSEAFYIFQTANGAAENQIFEVK